MNDYTTEYNSIVEQIEKKEEMQVTMPWLIGWLQAAIWHKDIDYEMAFKLINELIMETNLIKQ